MTIQDFFDLIITVGVILGFIFIGVTSFSKKGQDKSIIYINLVVLFLSLTNLQATFITDDYIEANYFIRKLLIPWYSLILPSFYTFVTYYLKVEKKIKSYVFISIVLFVLELVVRIVFIPYFYHENNNYIVAKYAQLEEIVNAAYTIFLFARVYILFFKYSKLYQYVLSYDNLNWLKQFFFLGFMVILMWVVPIILNLDKVINPEIFIYYPLRLSSSALLYWISYQGYFHYNLMSERISLREAIATEQTIVIPTPIVAFANKENAIVSNKDFLRIKSHIEKNKRYLDPLFSLEALSAETKIGITKLSSIINSNTSHHFSDYINSFRVENAKKYLIAPEYSNYTIVAIGLESGFNSKSTFYMAFKKFTNKTPSEFRKENS
jgi:AraC-like DNA-binding protein